MRFRLLLLLGFVLLSFLSANAQPFNPNLYSEMRWRMIGPHRGGRTVAITGVPGQANVFYIGVNNGGVWKTTDYGQTWLPIFDGQPTGSIGALAVAPSNPEIIYVGTGEGLRRPDLATGDGIYKSMDGGKTWQHLGLRDGQQISAIIVDPRDPNRVFVAVLGHPYGPNSERGIFRSLDGGQNWQRVLYKDENTGGIDLAFDPANAQVVYAAMWASRRPPWTTGNALQVPGSGLYKSTDGGNNWQQLTRGLPAAEQGLGRIGVGIAPSNPKRIYALVDAPKVGGLYRSEDAGESWQQINSDDRLWGRGSDFANVRVDPKNPDVVYVANVCSYRSSDAGKTFTALKGAPGGDDYHTFWINPENPQIVALASDQGATISVNGGETWSSWYNQPTAQFYHVITDNQFPYWVYGGQQESGSAAVVSRADYGAITFREWRPVGVEEYGYVAPDPLNPNIIYGGKVTRYDAQTTQTRDVSPVIVRTGKFRFNRTAPLVFSPKDPHALYLGSNVLFKTTDGGENWQVISPDLTREDPGVPPNLGPFSNTEEAKRKRRGVIYTVAPSPLDANLIWAGTDDGLVHVTRDGGRTWQNVSPPGLTSWSKLAMIDASHFDAGTAYAAVNRFRLDDLHAYIYRTHDGGKTWQKITAGIPDDGAVNVVREDPVRKGLLFAGTEGAIYVSFDDGDHWQSLQLNLPATSMRDLVVHGDDIVVGTHGRSFWILDDITPLRQLDAKVAQSPAHLFRPQLTYRVRRSTNTDTPLPLDTPAGQNPPDGAIINYYLQSAASGPVLLEIFDSAGKLARRFASNEKPEPINEKDFAIPMYWVRPPQIPSAAAGMHRFVWDLRYPAPHSLEPEFPISAIPHDTPLSPQGPAALPGNYTVKLTVGGQSYMQPLTLKMDPRVKTPAAGLALQFALESRIAAAMNRNYEAVQEIRKLRATLKSLTPKASGATAENLARLEQQAAALEGTSGGFGAMVLGGEGGTGLVRLAAGFKTLLDAVDSADAAPTAQAQTTMTELESALNAQLANWTAIKAQKLAGLDLQPQSPTHSGGR